MIKSFNGKTPKIAASAFVSEAAYIIGDVEIGENSCVWPGAGSRGDLGKSFARQIVHELVHRAYDEHATAVHITPSAELVVVEFRIAGVLKETFRLPRGMCDDVVDYLRESSTPHEAADGTVTYT
ncbi:MAG: hypothetical protein AABZ77_06050, partial [Chloroflexota bacterium]